MFFFTVEFPLAKKITWNKVLIILLLLSILVSGFNLKI